jgi:hypothetical protein
MSDAAAGAADANLVDAEAAARAAPAEDPTNCRRLIRLLPFRVAG